MKKSKWRKPRRRRTCLDLGQTRVGRSTKKIVAKRGREMRGQHGPKGRFSGNAVVRSFLRGGGSSLGGATGDAPDARRKPVGGEPPETDPGYELPLPCEDTGNT